MYAGSAAARRRRVLIASRSESPSFEDSQFGESHFDESDYHEAGYEDTHFDGAQFESLDDEAHTSPIPTECGADSNGRSRGHSTQNHSTQNHAEQHQSGQKSGGKKHRPGQHLAKNHQTSWDSKQELRTDVSDPAKEGRPSQQAVSAPVPPVPARRPPRAIAAIRSKLQPSAAGRIVELCVTSRLTGDTEILRIDTTMALVGRGSQCDIRLMHSDVSRRHACLQVLAGGVLCYDLGSRTGLRWNGERQPLGWITAERGATVGPFEIRLAEEGVEGGPDLDVPNGSAWGLAEMDGMSSRTVTVDGRPARLEGPSVADPEFETVGFEIVREADAGGATFLPMRCSVSRLGRGAQCEMRLKDERISRVHSSVLACADGVWLADLAGRGGIVVNGSRVAGIHLRPGDEVRLGSHRLRFVVDRPRPVEADAVDRRQFESGGEGPERYGSEGYVSESLVLAMVETFADMQRQMQEQFSVQMNVMVEMVESLRQESRDDVRAELARLRTLGEEIRDTQAQLNRTRLPAPKSGAPETDKASEYERPSTHHQGGRRHPASGAEKSPPERSRTTADGANGDQAGRRAVAGAEAECAKPRHFERSLPAGGGRLDGIADHALVSRKLRELEEERDSSWQRLMRMIKPGP